MSFRFIRRFLLFTLLLTTTVFVAYYHNHTGFFDIVSTPTSLEYKQGHEVIATQLRGKVEEEISKIKGQSLLSVSLSGLQGDLETLPWVKQASLRRVFPGTIETVMTLHEVLFTFFDTKLGFAPVLRSGEVLDQASFRWLPDSPLVKNIKLRADAKLTRELVKLFKQVPSLGPLRPSNLVELDLHPSNGLSLFLSDEETWVYLGKTKITKNALRVIRVLDYLKSQKYKARVIDGGFDKKVLVRLRKGS